MYVKNKLPIYEGDGFIHAGPAVGAADSLAAEAPRGIRDLERQARKLRAETVARLIAQAAAWVQQRFLYSRNAAVDEYLSRATSLADVERRLREIERNGSFLPG